MTCKVVYLEPIGSGGVKSELRSDALWGAICWAIRLLEGEGALQQFIQSYLNEGSNPCLISSAYPYSEEWDKDTQSWTKTHFFPMPLLPTEASNRFKAEGMSAEAIKIKHRELNQDETHEQLRQVRFENVLKGRKARPEVDAIPKVIQRPMTHNTIDRRFAGTRSIDDQGQLFHTDDTYLQNLQGERSGWFFLIQGDIHLISAALRFLEHFGIGGDRSTGKGRFIIHGPNNFTLQTPSDANAQMTLSLYRPSPEEIQAIQQSATEKNFNYQLEERRGRTIWRKNKEQGPSKRQDEAALYFKEGSIFPLFENSRPFCGQNPCVGQHPAGFDIYRYGHAFMLPIKIN
ncbi:MAG: hypothetical protein SFV55_20140 [Haliscomenobacter sp.]|uniref:type III-A CRISPR-associated RAMP protein Csm4 n=1 Tax=Haliscomenobacter sp. TaxID=2717303 RepID=UPI0029BDB0B7|nr:hypothetical protein [Haliscomenobacter sp.]MDX2070750.1 hypothetical protein [Haliscomenobacter sp.]